ncbi:GNAT family N-acetyltransferase [Streptomyces sp. M10(2022)]
MFRPSRCTRRPDRTGELDRATWSTLHAVQPRPQPRTSPSSTTVTSRGVSGGRGGDRLGEERIAGYIRLARSTQLACNAHVRQIQGLVVADWARGHGTGRALLRASFAEARRQGAGRITLRVLGHNTPARALYASEGFAVEGVLPGEFFLNGRYADDVLMGRSLAT